MIKSEINFNKIIIQPLWLIINRFYDDSLQVCMENNKNNIVCTIQRIKKVIFNRIDFIFYTFQQLIIF